MPPHPDRPRITPAHAAEHRLRHHLGSPSTPRRGDGSTHDLETAAQNRPAQRIAGQPTLPERPPLAGPNATPTIAETDTLALVASLVGAVVTTLIGSLRPGVSYRDMQGLLVGRGIEVDQATVYRCRALTPEFVGGPDGNLVDGWSYLFRASIGTAGDRCRVPAGRGVVAAHSVFTSALDSARASTSVVVWVSCGRFAMIERDGPECLSGALFNSARR